ncbi:hypothetical protein Hdeb2414_s0010g00340251 [Helianthus debilis subsp. tardiflorus]
MVVEGGGCSSGVGSCGVVYQQRQRRNHQTTSVMTTSGFGELKVIIFFEITTLSSNYASSGPTGSGRSPRKLATGGVGKGLTGGDYMGYDRPGMFLANSFSQRVSTHLSSPKCYINVKTNFCEILETGFVV